MIAIEKPLDLDAVQAFTLVADLGSFTRAAEVLETSQAAVSLKLKRLEDRLGGRLIDRTPRSVKLSAAGERFLDAARDLLAAHERAVAGLGAPAPLRRLILGVSDHAAGPELPRVLSRLAAYEPALTVEVRIGMSSQLAQAFDCGELDAAIVRRDRDRTGGLHLTTDRFGWFAAPTFERRAGDPLRLASLAAPCGVRAQAVKVLGDAGIAWNEVFVGGGLMAVNAALTASLAVAAMAHRVAPVGLVECSERLGLPPLPSSEVVLLSRAAERETQAALRVLSAAFKKSG